MQDFDEQVRGLGVSYTDVLTLNMCVESVEEADVILTNTCAVRENGKISGDPNTLNVNAKDSSQLKTKYGIG